MKTIAIIPARGGSKRLPHKNTMLLGNMPLLAHSILYAKQNSDLLSAIYVSTDDPEIKKIALQYGVEVIDRPKAISGDLEPTVSAVQHLLKTIDYLVDNVVLLQPTNPFRTQNLLRDALIQFQKHNTDNLFTVSQNFKKLGTIQNNTFCPKNYEFGQRSQDLEPLFFENGLLYIFKPQLALDGFLMTKTGIPMHTEDPSAEIDIDTETDFQYAQYLIDSGKIMLPS